jgi:hypothetical protein
VPNYDLSLASGLKMHPTILPTCRKSYIRIGFICLNGSSIHISLEDSGYQITANGLFGWIGIKKMATIGLAKRLHVMPSSQA